jgi:hypothetical protein
MKTTKRTNTLMTLAAALLALPAPLAVAQDWTPANSGVPTALWLDADDAGTITKDGGDLVSQWNDKSGNARHVTQATAANQPTYQAAGLNSKPTLYFALAIQESEKSPEKGVNKKDTRNKTSSGNLALLRWRAGKTETVNLKMRVLGTYSDTAPYNCPKSAKILEEACAALEKRPACGVRSVASPCWLQFAHGLLVNALFSGGLTDALKQADPEIVFKALCIGAKNADGAARSHVGNYFENRLTADDVKALMPEILEAVKILAPADTMYCNFIRQNALNTLVKYRFQEGIAACILFAKTMGGHGSEIMIGRVMKQIETYGSAAKVLIPDLKELIEELNGQVKRGEYPDGPDHNGRRVKDIQATIAFLEAAKDHPELLSAGPTPASTKDRKK